jgi:YD repeat-containing protein
LQSATQTLAGGFSRTVLVAYANAGAVLPSTLIFEGRTVETYDYDVATPDQLVGVRPAIGPGMQFDYNGPIGMIRKITMPAGGTVEYGWDTASESDLTPRVSQRTTGGRAVASGTWTFNYGAYNTVTNELATTVTAPDLSQQVTVLQTGNSSNSTSYAGPTWLVKRALLNAPGEIAKVEYTYINIACPTTPTCTTPVLETQTTTQDGKQFSKTFHYRSANYGDFQHAYQTIEVGDRTRTTTIDFDYDSTYLYVFQLGRPGTVTVTEGSESVVTHFTYESTTGLLTSSSVNGIGTTFSGDGFGNRATATDPNGHVTTYAYASGVLRSVQTPASLTTRVINSDGSVASETVNGRTTIYGYDDNGRIVSVQPPSGDGTIISYDNSGGASASRTTGGNTETTSLDGFGRALTNVSATGVVTTQSYDAMGLTRDTAGPLGGEHWDYDALGRVRLVTHAADQTKVHYDYSGTDVTVTDEAQKSTTRHWLAYGSPADARLGSVTDALGHTWGYGYNIFGSLTSVTPPSGPARTWTYDAHNWLRVETHPESGTVTYDYDPEGNRIGFFKRPGLAQTASRRPSMETVGRRRFRTA